MSRTIVGQIVYGNALSCNGTSQYAIYNHDLTAVTNNYTISLWVNVTGYPASGNACFFETGQSDANGYRVIIGTTGLLSVKYSTVLTLSSATTLSLSTWYHVVVVRDTGTTQQYVNGVAVGSTSGTSPFSPNAWALIGASKNSSSVISEFANAIFDDVRFYERALTSGEVANLYSQGSDPTIVVSTANRIAYWKIDESSGTTLADYSGNNFTMTLVGSPTFTQGIVTISNVPARTGTSSRSVSGARTLASI